MSNGGARETVMSGTPRTCIIGAGSSGIVAAKTLHQRGLPFDCFELGSGLGGIWRYNNDSGLSPAYKSLHINTSRQKMSYSDFAMPDSYPDFPHHSLILEYFESYVDHFGFRDKIQFNTRVCSLRPLDDGAWEVTVEPREGGARRVERYEAVVVASGHHSTPRYPDFEGRFDNRTLHASQYRTPEILEDQRVLVVGIGNSGCDIACEASRVAKAVYLSTRRGAHVIPKYIFGRPLDRIAPAWMWRHLPFRVFQRLFELSLYLSRGRLKKFGLPTPDHRILEEHPTISADLLNQLGHGEITIKPNVARLDGQRVAFADGSSERYPMKRANEGLAAMIETSSPLRPGRLACRRFWIRGSQASSRSGNGCDSP